MDSSLARLPINRQQRLAATLRTARNTRFRRLLHESLEERTVLASQWLVELDGLVGDTREEQLTQAQGLFAGANLGESGISAVDHLGFQGVLLVEAPDGTQEWELESQLAAVPGFLQADVFNPRATNTSEIPIDVGPGFRRSAGVFDPVNGTPDPGFEAPLAAGINGFDGVTAGQGGNWRPPDNTGAAGPNSYIIGVNNAISILNKVTGAPIAGPVSSFTFFSSVKDPGSNVFDPVVVFNEHTQRYGIGYAEATGTVLSRFVFAISKTSNPTTLTSADWNFFSYNTDDASAGFDFGDYPKMGYNADGFVISFNQFKNASSYDHSAVLAIRNDGTSPGIVVVPGGFTHFTLAPASMHTATPGGPMWFVESGQFLNTDTSINVVRMTNVFTATPAFTFFPLAVNTFFFTQSPHQPGGQLVGNSNLGPRFYFTGQRTVGGVNRLVATHTSAQSLGNAFSEVRWYEINITGATPTLIQQGTINAGAAVDTYFPDADIAPDGSIGLGYTQSSAGQFISGFVTGRLPTDPLGTMQAPVLAKAGTVNLIPNDRIGDYADTSVDPVDGSFWYTHQYSNNTGVNPNWRTWVQHFNVGQTFTVTSTTPAVASTVNVAPTSYAVNFSTAYNPATVNASDFSVNGIVAGGFILTDADTVTFTYVVSPAAEGLNTMTMAAGSMQSSTGTNLGAFSAQFRLDTVPLQILTTSPPPNSVINLGPAVQTIRVFLSEAVNPASIAASDFVVNQGTVGAPIPVLGNTAVDVPISGLATEGTLTLNIAANAFVDGAGNPNPAGFAASYVLDYVSRAYTTPLTAKNPLGSLIYDPTMTGIINFAGDVDNFTLNVDPGQTITVLVDPTSVASAGIAPIIELRDPANVLLASTSAGPGLNALLQTAHTTTGGIYTVSVGASSGTTGSYSVQVILNAALEAEGTIAGASNNTLATAQDINASFIQLGGAGSPTERGAALGTVQAGGSLVANGSFETGSFSGWTAATSGPPFIPWSIGAAGGGAGFGMVPLAPQDGTSVAWNGFDGTGPMEYTMRQDITLPVGAPLSLSWKERLQWVFFTPNAQPRSYFVELRNPSTNAILSTLYSFSTGTTPVNVPQNTGWQTHTANLSAFAGQTVRLQFREVIPQANTGPGQAEFDAIALSVASDTDWYKFTLAAGQTSTVALKALTGVGAGLGLALFDSAGVPVPVSVTTAANLDRVATFTAGASGDYFARVTSTGGAITYSLVATQDAALDTEPNDSFGTAQSINGLKGALGALTAGSAAAPTVVPGNLASVEGNSGNAWPFHIGQFGQPSMRYQQIYSSTAFAAGGIIDALRFRRDVGQPAINVSGIDLKITLSYAATSVTTASPTFASNIGAGAMTVFDGLLSLSSAGVGSPNPFDIVIDVANSFNYNPGLGNLLVDIFMRNSPVSGFFDASGAQQQTTTQRILSFPGNVNATSGFVGTDTANTTPYGLVTRFDFLAATANADWYSINVTDTSQAINLRTSTPADGPGEFVNNLNPKIELFSPANVLVASGVVLPDGRNEFIQYTPLVTGNYRVRVSSDGGTTGEYFLSRNQSPTVTAQVTSPIDEGDSAVLTGTISDEASDSHTVVIDWGPGEGSTTLNLAAGVLTFSASHTYADDNPSGTPADIYPISVTVTDNHGATGIAGGSILSPPAELITNGGFETGNFSGWINNSIGPGNWFINNGSFDPDGPGLPLAPISGTFDAVTSQNAPSLQILSEPIVVPAKIDSATLSWSDRIRNHHFAFAEPNQEWRVRILDAASNFIDEVFSTNPGDPLEQIGPNNRSFDLTSLLQSLAGQSIQISFELENDQFFFNVTLDNVSLEVVTSGVPSVPSDIFTTHNDGTRLGTIDPATGLGTDVGPFGTTQTWAAAFDTDGTLYTLFNGFGSANLATVNQATGAVTPIGTGLGTAMITLEVAADGTMYGIGAFDQILYRIDKALGTATPIGDTGINFTMDTAIDSDGTLYATTNNLLWTVDTATGASTFLGMISGGPGHSMGIMFDGSDTLFATDYMPDSPLYTVDLTTLAATLVGMTGFNFPHGGDIFVTSAGALEVTVNNVAPEITSLNAPVIDEDDTATISGTFFDPGLLDEHTVEITWGPGEGSTTLLAADLVNEGGGVWSFSASHQYLDDNPIGTTSDTYAIGVSVTDDDTGSDSAETTVTVDNVAPALDPLALGSCTDDNGVVTLTGSFTDPGTLDTHTVIINWGDGAQTTIDLTGGMREFTATHPYAPGTNTFAAVHSIGVSVADDDGGVDGVTANIAVAAGAGAYTLRRSVGGLNLQLLRGSSLIIDQPFDSIDLVVVVGAANKNDSLNVTGINGNPIPGFGVGFAGRAGNQDTLTISAATYDLMAYIFENGEDGHVVLQQGSLTREICFDDLEQITTTATTAVAQFHLPEDDQDAVLQKSGSSLTLTPATGIWARQPFVPTKFVTPTLNLSIAGRGGDDIVEIIGSSSITLPLATVMEVETTEIEMIHTATLTAPVMSVNGDLQINELGRLNGTTVLVTGDVTSEDPTLQGTAKISLIGDGNQSLSGPGQIPHLDISKSGGSVTVLSDFGVRGNLTGSGGTFAPSAAFLVLQDGDSTVNFSGPVALHNLEIYKIYTEEVTLLSDLVVNGDLRVSLGGLNSGNHTVTVGGNMSVAASSWLELAIDVAIPPTLPLLDVAGTLSFAAGSKLKVDTSGSSGPSAGGNHKIVEAFDIQGFAGAIKEFEAGVDAIFEDLESLYVDLVEP